MPERTGEAFQEMLDTSPAAQRYYSDGFPTYNSLWYPGTYTQMLDKSQTYSVEGDNADLRHYLARLARRSRCFSRCIQALRRAVDLFVFYYNQRQKAKRQNPKYNYHLIDFVTML